MQRQEASLLPGQKATVITSSSGLTGTALRVLEVRHEFSKAGFTTELDLTDDLTNYQALEPVRLANLLGEAGGVWRLVFPSNSSLDSSGEIFGKDDFWILHLTT